MTIKSGSTLVNVHIRPFEMLRPQPRSKGSLIISIYSQLDIYPCFLLNHSTHTLSTRRQIEVSQQHIMSEYALPNSRSGHKTVAGSIDHVLAFIDTYDDTQNPKRSLPTPDVRRRSRRWFSFQDQVPICDCLAQVPSQHHLDNPFRSCTGSTAHSSIIEVQFHSTCLPKETVQQIPHVKKQLRHSPPKAELAWSRLRSLARARQGPSSSSQALPSGEPGSSPTSRHSQTRRTRHRIHSHCLAHTPDLIRDTKSTFKRHNGIPRPPPSVPRTQQHKPRFPDQRCPETREAACCACEEACWCFPRRVSLFPVSLGRHLQSALCVRTCKHATPLQQHSA